MALVFTSLTKKEEIKKKLRGQLSSRGYLSFFLFLRSGYAKDCYTKIGLFSYIPVSQKADKQCKITKLSSSIWETESGNFFLVFLDSVNTYKPGKGKNAFSCTATSTDPFVTLFNGE